MGTQPTSNVNPLTVRIKPVRTSKLLNVALVTAFYGMVVTDNVKLTSDHTPLVIHMTVAAIVSPEDSKKQ
jgi:hypothetical protein